MKKILLGPLILSLVAALSGAATGLAWYWQAADAIVERVLAAREKPEDTQKAQGWDFWTIEIDSLASELKEERARLMKLSEQVDQRTARLTAEQQELEKVRAELEGMRREIGERVIEIKTDESKNLRTLAQTYTNLSPPAAVAILREMDDVTVVKILSLMKPDVVGPIFEEMTRTAGTDGTLARRAADLSEKLRLMKANRPANS